MPFDRIPEVASEPAGYVLGVKLVYLVAGFAGGVVSLSFLKELTFGQAVLAVFTGAASAAYGTPLVAHYFPSINEPLLLPSAFLIGLTAMNLIPGVMKLSEVFRDNPAAFLPGILKGKQREGDGK